MTYHMIPRLTDAVTGQCNYYFDADSDEEALYKASIDRPDGGPVYSGASLVGIVPDVLSECGESETSTLQLATT